MNNRNRILRALGVLPLAMGVLHVNATGAVAMGYDSLSCKELWDRRTEIEHRNGLCFSGELEIKTYGNETCSVKSEAELKLSDIERRDVAMIKIAEERKQCSSP